MRRTAIALILALLYGCTTTESVRSEGDRTEHALRQSPHDAAGCVARQAEAILPGIQTYVRSGGNGAMEVIVRNGPDFVFAVVDIKPADKGSLAVQWLKPGWFYRKGQWVHMTDGC